ncbi:MAG: hypothetical protein JNN12_00725 [Bacteroidetes Order II. Incertae sedis bacterium]|nr:hypothetical protein [Bacteroidetes Order II. bacterium]
MSPSAKKKALETRPKASIYRLDLLKPVPPFYLRARSAALSPGQLVYYGPMPSFYGIGEVIKQEDKFVIVDFRGTGMYSVHLEALSPEYLIPIPPETLYLL